MIYVCICENGFNNEEFLNCNCSCRFLEIPMRMNFVYNRGEVRNTGSVICFGNYTQIDDFVVEISAQVMLSDQDQVQALSTFDLVRSSCFSVGLFYGMYRIRFEKLYMKSKCANNG